jgi:hypothetical protein
MMPITRLLDDPYCNAKSNALQSFDTIKLISTLENSADGTGPWIAVHLLDVEGKFIQGGWLLITTDLLDTNS